MLLTALSVFLAGFVSGAFTTAAFLALRDRKWRRFVRQVVRTLPSPVPKRRWTRMLRGAGS